MKKFKDLKNKGNIYIIFIYTPTALFYRAVFSLLYNDIMKLKYKG